MMGHGSALNTGADFASQPGHPPRMFWHVSTVTATAIRIAHALEPYEITWFEEPITPDHAEGMAEVKRRANVPIAGGERLYSRWDARSYLTRGCADVLQPDVSHVGGIGELRKIAAMAETFSLPVCPHNPIGPVANAATLHLAACVPNFWLLETMSTDVPWRGDVTTEYVRFAKGEMLIPEGPGLGLDLNLEAIAEHPYERRNLRHYTGALTEIRPPEAVAWFRGENE
jgi:galactonate dehydratase